MKSYTLNNDVTIPVLGFGTWKAENGEIAYQAVLEALKAGYRHIDTAAIYKNEESVGRAIGVSNFLPHHLDALLETATIIPAVNQVRLAPGVYQEEVVDFCREKGILLEAWGPFGQGELFDSKQVQEIAVNHGKSVAQIALAWSLAEGFLPLPKSVTASRIQANLDCFGIELSHEERETLKTIAVQSGAPRVDDMDF